MCHGYIRKLLFISSPLSRHGVKKPPTYIRRLPREKSRRKLSFKSLHAYGDKRVPETHQAESIDVVYPHLLVHSEAYQRHNINQSILVDVVQENILSLHSYLVEL